MRIRVRKQLQGVVQGVSLSQLTPGMTYDIDATLAGYLVAVGAADAVSSKVPALVTPLDTNQDLDKALGGVSVTQVTEDRVTLKRKRFERGKSR